MFPETDGISNIISDTMKVVFQRRLVDRVLRLWKEMAHREPFPRRDQIEPAMLETVLVCPILGEQRGEAVAVICLNRSGEAGQQSWHR